MPFANSTAVVILSMILGASVSLNITCGESYLLSVAQPIVVVWTAVAAGVGDWVFLTYVLVRRRKFGVFTAIWFSLYALVLALIVPSFCPDIVRGVVWLFLGVWGYRIFRWSIAQFVVRHLDPARSQSHISYLVATYEGGMLLGLLALKFLGRSASPPQMIAVSAGLCLLAVAFIIIQFCPRKNFEVEFTHRQAEPPQVDEERFEKLILSFGLVALFFGLFKFSEEYLVRIALKEHLTSFAAIRNQVVNYRLISNASVVALGLVAFRPLKRKQISPVGLLTVAVVWISAVWVYCVACGTLNGFVAFEVTRWVTENFIYFLAMQTISLSFIEQHRARLSARQNLSFYTIAGVSCVTLFTFTQFRFPEYQKTLLLVAVLVAAAGTAVQTWRLRAILPGVIYDFLRTGHKQAGILAVNLLGFLRPRNYEAELDGLLKLSPKKLLRKNIILCLGYSGESKAQELIIKEFASDQEEIQIAVLDALRIAQQYQGAQFLAKVTRAEVRPKTLRVRINATAALAAMYGRHSVPFLLYGLDDEDNRIVANTLETLAEFRDPELIPFFRRFADAPFPRSRANALMGLAGFRATRVLFVDAARAILNGSDPHMQASILYVIGKLRDRSFSGELDRLFSAGEATDANVRRCLTWALMNLGDARGLAAATEIFRAPSLAEIGKENPITAFMHFFAQFSKEARMDLIREVAVRYRGETQTLHNLEEALQLRTYDFHEELDYLYVLKAGLDGS